MFEEMERDETVFLMGQDIGHYQGAYEVSKGLLDKFGERPVIDTPLLRPDGDRRQADTLAWSST